MRIGIYSEAGNGVDAGCQLSAISFRVASRREVEAVSDRNDGYGTYALATKIKALRLLPSGRNDENTLFLRKA